MKTLSAILFLWFISCRPANTETHDNKDSNSNVNIPLIRKTKSEASQNDISNFIDKQLVAYLDTNFNGWTMPEPNRWDTIWFNQYKNDGNFVNYVTGDFDCNNKKDYVLLFKQANSSIVAYSFLSKRNSFQSFQLFDFGTDNDEMIEYGLELLPPGIYSYMDPESDEAPSVSIKCNAVQILYFEKGAETFYWEKGKLQSIMTGD